MTIIAFLVGLLIPALGLAKSRARELECRANLRTLMVLWTAAVTENKGRIAETRYRSIHPNWEDYLDSQLTVPQLLWDGANDRFNVCPDVERAFPQITYVTSRWGFAVNNVWSDTDPITPNSGKRWSAIPQPSDYPFFADAQPYEWGSSHTAVRYLPFKDWEGLGLGFHHQRRTAANAVFADGHVEGGWRIEGVSISWLAAVPAGE